MGFRSLREAGWFFGPTFGLDGFCETVAGSLAKITKFVLQVVLHRKEYAIRKWRTWVLEDPLVHSYRWLRPDNVPPAPFLSCDTGESEDGSGVLVNPHDIDQHFQKAWMHFSVGVIGVGLILEPFGR